MLRGKLILTGGCRCRWSSTFSFGPTMANYIFSFNQPEKVIGPQKKHISYELMLMIFHVIYAFLLMQFPVYKMLIWCVFTLLSESYIKGLPQLSYLSLKCVPAITRWQIVLWLKNGKNWKVCLNCNLLRLHFYLATPYSLILTIFFSRETWPIQRHLNIQFQTPQDKTNAK